MTGKCKWRIQCPQCIEETGTSRVFKSLNHFRQHLQKHAVLITTHIPDTVAAWGGDFIPAHDHITLSCEGWWDVWGEKWRKLNNMEQKGELR